MASMLCQNCVQIYSGAAIGVTAVFQHPVSVSSNWGLCSFHYLRGHRPQLLWELLYLLTLLVHSLGLLQLPAPPYWVRTTFRAKTQSGSTHNILIVNGGGSRS